MTVSKVFFIIAVILFLLSLFVDGPLVALGLAALAAGHAL